MSTTTAIPVSLVLPHITLTGHIRHDRGAGTLDLLDEKGVERLSTDLSVYGCVAGMGEVFIKDWSEHAGLADALAIAGAVSPPGVPARRALLVPCLPRARAGRGGMPVSADVRFNPPCLRTSEPLGHIITLTGDAYEQVVDEANAMGGSVDAVAAVLSVWDYGDETDAAAELDPYDPTASDLGKPSHQLHSAHVGHQHYWLLIDHQLGLYSLYRLPLEGDPS